MPLYLDRMIGTPFFRKGAQRRPYARCAYARPEQRRAAAGADARRLERMRGGWSGSGIAEGGIAKRCRPNALRRRCDVRTLYFTGSAYSIVFGIIKFNMMPTTVESATPPKLNTKSLPTVNCKMPPPIPMTMTTDEMVRLRLSL